LNESEDAGLILTQDKILEAIDSGEISIDPFEEDALDAASYDMTLYHQLRVFIEGLNEIDLMDMAKDPHELMNITRIVNIPPPKYYLLKPGELVLGMTVEKLFLAPNIAGMLEGRSRFARMGLMVHVTASFLQPGLRGTRQVFEIYNASRNAIKLRSGVRIAQVVFERCEGNATYKGVFANQRRL
jgi:dCTP deaminase